MRFDTIGKTRERLASMLREFGLEIESYDLDPAKGRVRNGTAFEYDGVRWWGRGKTKSFFDLPDGMGVNLYGYDTMTNCVKYGIALDHFYRDIVTDWNVYAKETESQARNKVT